MTAGFYESIKHFLFLGRLSGITVFFWNDENTWVPVLYHLPYYILYTVGNFMAYNTVINTPTNGIYMRMGNISLYFENVLFMTTRFPYFIYKRKDYKKTLQKINAMSALFGLKHKPHGKIYIIATIILLAYIFIQFAKDEINLVSISYFNSTLMELYDTLIMYLALRELFHQYEYINRELNGDIDFLNIEKVVPAGIGGRRKNENISIIKANEKNEYLNRIFYLCGKHRKISKICKNLNAILGIPALGFFGMVFTIITLNTHYIALQLRNATKGLDLDCMFVGIKGLQILATMYRLVVIVNIISRVTAEAKSTIIYLHKLWNVLAKHNEIDLNAKHLKLLVVQLYNVKPGFSTNGLFEIDWPVVLMIIGATATYVVILIQFEIALGLF